MQRILDLYESPRYLEIGLYEGQTFRSVDAAVKVAVDPKFAFDLDAARSAEPESQFHEVTSDEYFGSVAPGEQFEVIFLDGLHTFEQTLRDFTNAVSFLSRHGVILIDDVTPISHLSALPDERRFQELRQMLGVESGAWMGDVFRLVYFLDTFWQQFTFRTIEETESQLVAWRSPRGAVTDRSVAEIAAMSFDEMMFARECYHVTPLATILDEIRTLVGESAQP